MPIITPPDADTETPLLPQTVAPASTQTPESPSALDVTAAAFRQNNILSSVVGKAMSGGYTDYPAVPGYTPYADNGADIRGYEQYADRFAHSESPEQTQQIKNEIDQETADKATLARAGKWGYAASMAAGAVDPITLTSMLLPGIGEAADVGRLARIGELAATNVATGEAQAGALAANQETGSYTQGMLPRIGVNALLAGVLGGIAPKIPRPELDALTERTATRLEAPESSTAGAAAVPTTTLEDESIAKGGGFIAKSVGRVSPITRIFANSKVPEARQLAQQLVDVPYMLEKNLKGVATPSSVEMRVNQTENIRNARLFQEFDAQYAEYKLQGGELTKPQFSAAVADAMRNGDEADIVQARKVAQFARPLFTQDRATLAKLGALGEGDDVIGAPSYFPRVYDVQAVMANRADVEQRLFDWFSAHPKIDEDTGLPIEREPAEIKQSVYDALDNIQGSPRGTADIPRLKNPQYLKGRSLDVPDEILKPYLSSDFEHVMSSYNHSVLPQIELRKQFGSVELADQLQQVRDAYGVKIEYADNEGKAKLLKQRDADIMDLTLLRDRLLNQTGPRGNEPLQMVRAAQLARSFNYLRMLGGQTLSAIPDVGRLVTRYGLANTGRRLAAFLASSEARALTKADAQRMGTALDNVLHTRMHTLDGIGDELAGSQLADRMHNAAARFTKLTGIASWDAMMRTLSAQLEQDALYRAVMHQNLPMLERAKLASHGIGEAQLPAIREQWLKYGSSEGGLNRARTELWDDQDAARTVEQAVQRAGSSNAFFVGKGDLPGFANSQLGKLLLQFKAFAISSVNRLAIPLAQGLAHRDVMAANGLMSMLALGALAEYTKDLADGYEPDLSPDSIIPNAVQRSGILTFIPDLYDPVAGAFHLPRFSKFQNFDPLETLMGPTFGTGAAVLDAVRRATKGSITAADLHKFRQLLPYQNLFYFARLVNMLEGETADALGAKGAPVDKSAADYFNPSDDIAPRAQTDKTHLFGVQAIPNAF